MEHLHFSAAGVLICYVLFSLIKRAFNSSFFSRFYVFFYVYSYRKGLLGNAAPHIIRLMLHCNRWSSQMSKPRLDLRRYCYRIDRGLYGAPETYVASLCFVHLLFAKITKSVLLTPKTMVSQNSGEYAFGKRTRFCPFFSLRILDDSKLNIQGRMQGNKLYSDYLEMLINWRVASSSLNWKWGNQLIADVATVVTCYVYTHSYTIYFTFSLTKTFYGIILKTYPQGHRVPVNKAFLQIYVFTTLPLLPITWYHFNTVRYLLKKFITLSHIVLGFGLKAFYDGFVPNPLLYQIGVMYFQNLLWPCSLKL